MQPNWPLKGISAPARTAIFCGVAVSLAEHCKVNDLQVIGCWVGGRSQGGCAAEQGCVPILVKCILFSSTIVSSPPAIQYWDIGAMTEMRQVKAREKIIYGTSRAPPKLHEVKQAWEEVAVNVSSFSGICRTATHCRKRYADVKRRGKQNFKAWQRHQLETGEGPPRPIEDLTSVVDSGAFSTLSVESVEGFGGLEVGCEDPEDRPRRPELEVAVERDQTEDQASRPRGKTSRPRLRRRNTARQEEHPFLDLQQSGFNMLQRELGGIRQCIQSVNSRLSRIEVLLRPLGRIADNLERLAVAVERFVPAAPPPPLSTKSVSRTLPRAAPGPSRVWPRRGAPYLRTRTIDGVTPLPTDPSEPVLLIV
ncbi:hypothetical protein JZ751_002579 [Albula glossodonta]|uniref:Myb/SANT-like DNA-binding domain-containing protein n=1 Tax=Albula glossodonta TaxID=121402 RepID=A0A8T2NEX4_9TELE|nr:hypothetical protein JZ751_002579 [Albula glossodonta]